MEKQEILFSMQRIANCWGVNVYWYNTALALQGKAVSAENVLSKIEPLPAALTRFYKKCVASPMPLVLEEQQNIYYFGMQDKTAENWFLIGPYSNDFLDAVTLQKYLERHSIPQEDFPDFSLPFLDLNQALSMGALSCYLLTGQRFTEKEIAGENRPDTPSMRPNLIHYKLNKSFQETQRLSYEAEHDVFASLERGEITERKSYPLSVQNLHQVGVLSKEGNFKQTEYTFVAGITLATRAIIRGGTPPYEAYDASDVALQKLSTCETTMEMVTVYSEAIDTMNELCKTYREKRSGNYYIEKAKQYISSHLHEKLTVVSVAEHLGISSTHLSRLFSKYAGVSFSGYISELRLNRAAEMLEFTDYTLAEITEYLGFSSQSYMGLCFRKQYGVTPAEYRNNSTQKEAMASGGK